MKRFLLFMSMLALMFNLQAQYVSFGDEYEIQKGDFCVADIDNDGDLDIIFSGEFGGGEEKGAVLINDGEGNFTKQEGEDRLFKICKGGNIRVGDINGDGSLDVIFAGWGNAATRGIALNDGNGNFTLASDDLYPIDNYGTVTSCGFADFNLDGLLDYYFFGNNLDNCIIYFQQPDGSFLSSTESFGNLNFVEPEVTVVDYDNDGYPDIFISAFSEDTGTRFSSLFKNDGFGEFTEFLGVDVFRKKANGTVSWGDFNGDGYIDFILNGDGWLNSGEDNDGIVRIYENQGGTSSPVGATFEWYRQNGVGNGSVAVDWDNDGKLDFIIGGWNSINEKQETALYLNTNPATFEFVKSSLTDTYFPGISEQGFRVADLNGDNKVDLLLCGYSGGTMDFKKRIAGYVLNQSEKASVPPAAPTNLNAVVEEEDGVMITFSWDAPESESTKHGTTYNLSLKNTTTGKWLYNPMAVVGGENNGWRKEAGRMGNVFANTSFELYDLPDGDYEWSVQAINGAYFGGAFAAIQTFTVGEGASVDQFASYKPIVVAGDKRVYVKGEAGIQTLHIYSINGAILLSENFSNEINVQLPSAGAYIVEITKDGNIPYRTKLIVK